MENNDKDINLHKSYYALMEKIETEVKTLSDDDIHFAYYLHYEDDDGFFERLVKAEYWKRKEKK